MAYSALAVANAFIERALQGRIPELSPMKLQKLLFYVQSWYLRNHPGQPLFDDFFARWKHGPVIPSIYHEFKHFGSSNVTSYGSHLSSAVGADGRIRTEVTTPRIAPNDVEAARYIDEAIRVYGQYNGWELSWMTHQPGTAWAISGPADGGVIPLDIMANHIHPG